VVPGVNERLKEHLQLLGKRAIVLVGSGVLLVIGVVDLVRAHHRGHSAWFWLFWGCLILFVVEASVVNKALRERDTAREMLDRAPVPQDHQSELQGRLKQFTHATGTGAGFSAGSENQQAAFRAHFPGLMSTVDTWNTAVVRARDAPAAVYQWLEAECDVLGIEAPTYVRETVLKTLHDVLLTNPPGNGNVLADPTARIVLRWAVSPDFEENPDTLTRLYLGNEINDPLAFIPTEPRATQADRADIVKAPINDLLARAQTSAQIRELAASIQQKNALVQPAYAVFEPHFGATIYAVKGCPFCDAQHSHRTGIDSGKQF
jgi:hypothetical protein